MTPAEREQMRRQVVASRRRQGRPDTVEDTTLLDRLATELVPSALNDTSGPAVSHRAAEPSAAAKHAKGRAHHATAG
jgi:hypothetical protein